MFRHAVAGTVFLLLLFLRTGPSTYYVATTGDDDNPGTIERPWRRIAKANEELEPGDTVFIRAGVYDEIIEPYQSGETGKPITYTNYADEQVIVRGEEGRPHIVLIGGSANGPPGPDSYIIVDGLTLSYGHDIREKRFGWVIIKGPGSEHNEIRNTTILRPGDPIENRQTGWDEFGIVLDGAKNNRIENNDIAGMKIGLKITNAAQHNRIRNNTIHDTYQSAISVGSGDGVMQGNLIEWNILEDSAIEDGIQFLENDDARNREADISNFGTIVRNNLIRNNAENAIDLKGAAHVLIEGNIIYGSIGSSDGPLKGWNREVRGAISRGSRTSTRDVIIRNNVVYDNASGIRPAEGYMVYNNTIMANNRDFTGTNSKFSAADSPSFTGIFQRNAEPDSFSIMNNIIMGHNVVEVALRLNANPTVRIDHNLYGNDAFSNFRTNNAWKVYSFSEWQAELANRDNIFGDEQHSFRTDEPLFKNAPSDPTGDYSQYNFDLSAESPAIDAGGPLTYTVGSGSGNQIVVKDARYFFDGYGITLGDQIRIGSRLASIKAIDHEKNILTITRDISWSDGDGVGLNYFGLAPDIGAREYFEIPQRRGFRSSTSPLYGASPLLRAQDARTAPITSVQPDDGGIMNQTAPDPESVEEPASGSESSVALNSEERQSSTGIDVRLLALIGVGILALGAGAARRLQARS